MVICIESPALTATDSKRTRKVPAFTCNRDTRWPQHLSNTLHQRQAEATCEFCNKRKESMRWPVTGAPAHRFSKCSVRSPRAPREKPRGFASYLFTYLNTDLGTSIGKQQCVFLFLFLEIYCGAP